MHRIYTKEHYMEKVAMLREIVPNVTLGTDIIVGFPTETDEEFEETYKVLEEVRYSVAFLFSYSARKGTPAFRWKDDIAEEVKQERLHRLLDLHAKISAEERQSMIGQEVEVLVENHGKETDQLKGRTRCWKNTVFNGDKNLVGTLQKVKVTGYSNQTLLAEKK